MKGGVGWGLIVSLILGVVGLILILVLLNKLTSLGGALIEGLFKLLLNTIEFISGLLSGVFKTFVATHALVPQQALGPKT